MHARLLSQLEMNGGDRSHPPADWEGFLRAIEAAYRQSDGERAALENSLERQFGSEQMLRKILDTIPQRVFWKDLHSVYLGCNRPLAQDFGFSEPAEMVGRTDHDTMAKEAADRHRADDWVVMESDKARLNYEESQARADGTTGWLKVNKVPLHDKKGKVNGLLCTYEDLTDRKRLEAQFLQAQKMEAFGQLAGGVAHDFNNLLTIIIASLGVLRGRGLSPPEQAEAIDDCARAAERAANLTAQLLTFSRRRTVVFATLNLNDVVANVTKMLHRIIGEHIALETIYAAGGSPVRADGSVLEQALINLAVNARDAMPAGGKLTLETSRVDRREANGHGRPGLYIRLRATDTGTGIAPEHLPHIFEPFFTTKEPGQGTGLGLATVFGIMEQHGGWVEVDSALGKGTTFSLYFPEVPHPGHFDGAPARDGGQAAGGVETILLVEDEPEVRQLMRRLLENAGYRVLEAESGRAALPIWESNHSDTALLLTDVVMPGGLGGKELASRLSAAKPRLKVMFCSGYSDEMAGPAPALRTPAHFLQKPFDAPALLRRVRDCLDEL